MAEMTMIDAIRAALARALEEDPDVVIFGEDVGIDGGVFRATDGLVQRFGASRVRDTPLSETVIAGVAVGARLLAEVAIGLQREDFLHVTEAGERRHEVDVPVTADFLDLQKVQRREGAAVLADSRMPGKGEDVFK